MKTVRIPTEHEIIDKKQVYRHGASLGGLIGKPHFETRKSLRLDVVHWLCENTKVDVRKDVIDGHEGTLPVMIKFHDENEALLFKMRWL